MNRNATLAFSGTILALAMFFAVSVQFAHADDPLDQIITVNSHAPANATYKSSFSVSATAGSGFVVVISTSGGCSDNGSGTVTMTSGTTACVVYYNQAGDIGSGDTYNPAPQVTETVTAQKAVLTVTGITASNKVYNDTATATLNTGSAVLNGAVGGDSITPDYTGASGVFGDENVGNGKTVTISGITTNADTNNYTLTQPTTTANITVRTVNVTAQTDSKTYDSTTSSAVSPVVGALQGSDTVGTAPIQTFDNKNVGTNKTLTASGLVITDGNSGANYSINYVNDTTGVITVRPITVTAKTDTKVYDGTTSSSVTPSVPALQGSDATSTAPTQTFDNKNVNTGKTLTASGFVVNDGNGGANYSVSYVPDTTGVITTRAITVTADAKNKVYGASDPTFTYQVTSGALQGADALTGSLSRISGEDVGDYFIVQSTLAASSNYALTYVAGTFSITAKNLTVSGITASKAYDGTTAATLNTGSASFTGIVFSDVITLNSSGVTSPVYNNKNIGVGKAITYTGSFALAGANAGNYTLSQPTLTGDITAVHLTGTFTASNKVYDATTAATVTLRSLNAGVVGSEDVTLSGGTATFADKHVDTGKTVTLSGASLAGADIGNYVLDSVNTTTANVTARPLTVTAQTDTKVYNGTTASAVSPSVPALQGSDTVGTAPTQVFNNKNVGTNKTLIASGLVITDGNSGANYSINYVNDTTGAITAKSLTVSATANSKVYDSTTAATASLSDNRVGGDVLSVASTSVTFASASVGTGITVTVNGISISGTDSGNYTVNASATSAADITARPITVTADAKTKVYSKDSGTDPAFTYSVTSGNLVGGDSISGSLTRVAGETFGTYSITQGTVTAGSNYNLTYVPANLSITKKALTVTLTADDKVYDGTTGATGTFGDDRISGDTLSIASTSVTFATKHVGTNKTVTAAGISISGADSGNYTVNTSATDTADITTRALTVTAQTDTKVYDRTTSSSVSPSVPMLQTGDTVGTAPTQTFDTKNVGTGKTLTASGLVVNDGNSGANYSVSYTDDTTGAITAKTLIVSATVSNKIYDTTTSATVASLSDDRVSGDVLSATSTSAVFADANVGTGKTVTVSGISISGTDSGNYSANTSTTTTANITAKSMTVTAADKSKEFGGVDPALTYTPTTLLGSDAFSGSLTRASGETVGTYSITQGTLSAGSNYSITFVPGTFTIGDTTPPVITLTGSATTSVVLDTTYSEPGYSALDAVDGSVTPVVTGTVNTSVAGTYTLTYTATDSSTNASSKTRTIVVSATSLSVTPVTSATSSTGTLTNAQSNSASVNGTPVVVVMPANLEVTGPLTWDGTINLPTSGTATGLTTSDVVSSSIEIGLANTELTFNKGVRLFFPNQANKSTGWSRGGAFTPITAACAADDQATGDALPDGGDCRINVGADLVIWTKHFTTFTTYSAAVSAGSNGPISGSLGGGGGSGFVNTPTPTVTNATQPQGQVLGASVFLFSTNMTLGSKGQSVTELQKLLIAGGFLKAEATGYFGGQTRAALVAYQKAHGISPASGYVGALTRAELNKGSNSVSVDAKASVVATLQAQIKELLAKIAALKATSTVTTGY